MIGGIVNEQCYKNLNVQELSDEQVAKLYNELKIERK